MSFILCYSNLIRWFFSTYSDCYIVIICYSNLIRCVEKVGSVILAFWYPNIYIMPFRVTCILFGALVKRGPVVVAFPHYIFVGILKQITHSVSKCNFLQGAHRDDSEQPTHICRLIGALAASFDKLRILLYSQVAIENCSDCCAQSDLSVCWTRHKVKFFLLWDAHFLMFTQTALTYIQMTLSGIVLI